MKELKDCFKSEFKADLEFLGYEGPFNTHIKNMDKVNNSNNINKGNINDKEDNKDSKTEIEEISDKNADKFIYGKN